MSFFISNVSHAIVGPGGRVDRRDFLRTIGVGAAGLAGLGWHDRLVAAATDLKKRGKSIIVLWMQGGPSQLETFDPKTGDNAGETKSIATAIPGVQVAQFWPKVAAAMKDITLIRTMTNKEGNHQRATYQLHTGYPPSGTLKHPSLGSLVASEIGPTNFDLPSFVSIAGPSSGPGFLPVAYSPFRVDNPAQMPSNTETLVPEQRYERRLSLLSKLENGYARAGAKQEVEDHQSLYKKASKLVLSPKLEAFDVQKESQTVRQEYGSSAFGTGCLLARRLVEAGVTFVEVQLGNWDTHEDNNTKIAELAVQCDPAYAALINDLKRRGLFNDTIVLWMGEFGRTPKINPRGGRDHFPRAFNAAISGGGIRGGQVIGKTTAGGDDIADRPVAVTDLFRTICQKMGVDPQKENQTPVGRPIRVVDGGQPIPELI